MSVADVERFRAGFSKPAGFDLLRSAGLRVPRGRVLALPLDNHAIHVVELLAHSRDRWMVRTDAGPCVRFRAPGARADAKGLVPTVVRLADELVRLGAQDARIVVQERISPVYLGIAIRTAPGVVVVEMPSLGRHLSLSKNTAQNSPLDALRPWDV